MVAAYQTDFSKDCAKGGRGWLPCCDWVGDGGAGHYVKMVHNGIEYGDMQLIAEAYFLLSNLLGCSIDEMQEIFAEWKKGVLNSFLIEITAQIFKHKDTDGKPLIDKILDVAGQKGTGKWTGISALDLGIPVKLDCGVGFCALSICSKRGADCRQKNCILMQQCRLQGIRSS